MAETRPDRYIRALIVDDEYPARAELRYQLSRHPDVQVTGEAATAREALRLIEALQYDVVFLDIAMPGLSGIELAERLRGRPQRPFVVFVTAYDDYAVKAFETRALDYILKPFDEKRVGEALERVRERLGAPEGASAAATGAGAAPGEGPNPRWVIGMRGETAIPIALDEIVFLTSERDQVYVHTRHDRYLTRYTLRELESLLPADRFFRCHRGYIVNLRHVREISPFFNGTYTLSLPQGTGVVTVPVARSRVAELKRLFWPGGTG